MGDPVDNNGADFLYDLSLLDVILLVGLNGPRSYRVRATFN